MTKKETAIILELLQEVKELRKEVKVSCKGVEQYKIYYDMLSKNFSLLHDVVINKFDLLQGYEKSYKEYYNRCMKLQEFIHYYTNRN